jgi:hypothetical protein
MAYKVVYNNCFGGFGISEKAVAWLKERYPELTGDNYDIGYSLARHDARLVSVVEALGTEASDSYSRLKVETIYVPMYRIDEYDGRETVQTPSDIDWVSIKE